MSIKLDLEQREKIYFAPGELVTIKHDLPNKPVMLVKEKVSSHLIKGDGSHFIGIRCYWFTTDHRLESDIFSTKDLIHA